MPEEEKFLPIEDDLSLSYRVRREAYGMPEFMAEDFFKKKARKEMTTASPEKVAELRRFFAKKALERLAEGWDKEQVEATWGTAPEVEPVFYEPADLIADIATFGLSTPGRQAAKVGLKAARAGEKEVLEQTGKYFARETAREVGFGALAGASMVVADEFGAGPIVEMMSGLIGPTATLGVATLTRKGFATWMRRVSQKNPDLHARILREADELPDNEFARLVKEVEAPGGPPWKPEISPEPSVTLDDLKKSPSLADYVLKRPETHPPEVLEQAQKFKSQFPDIAPTKPKVEPIKPKEPEWGKDFEARLIESVGDPGQPLVHTRKRQEAIQTWMEIAMPELPERAININFARINAPDDIKTAIAKMAKLYEPEIQVARRGKVSLKETERLADDLGMSVEQLLKRRRGEAFNAETALAARNIMVSSAANLHNLAVKAAAPIATDVDKFAFRRALNMHYAIQAEVSGMTAEAGRALGSFRIEAMGTAEKARQIRDMLFTMEGAIPIEKQAALIATLPTTQAVTTTVKQAQKANTWDMFLEAWINGLLSGPQTHAVNTGSNQLFALWQIPERYLAAGISRITPGPQEIKAGEAGAQAWGMIEGIKDGLRMGGKALKEAEPEDPLSKIELRRYRAITAENMNLDPAGPAGRTADFLGEVARLPSRFLVAEDEFFKGMGYRMELHAQAYRQAAMDGLEGKEFAKRVQQILNDPPENIRLAGQNAARYQTYTNELGKAGKAFQQILHDVPVLRLVIPFFRTGANIAKVTGERTPLAPFLKHWRADIAAGGARRDLAIAKTSAGSMTLLTFGTLAAQGYITGAGPPDKAARQSLRNMGWQSYSFCTNPGAPMEERKYIRFSRIDPFGALLGLSADAVEIMAYSDEVGADEIAAMCAVAIAENVSSKTWIKGVTDFIEASSDPKRYMTKYLERMAGTVIPTALATVERTIHPQFDEVNSWLDAIKSRTPGLSKDLPPRLNLWGEPIIGGTIRGEEGNWMWIPVDLINPLYVSRGKKSPIDAEIYKNAISVGKPGKNIAGVNLTDEEYHRYVELQGKVVKDERTGKSLKETLDFIVEHPAKAQALGLTTLRYDKMSDGPDGYKAVTIKKIIQHFRGLAQIQLREEFPELDRLIEELRMEKVEAIAGGMQ